MKMKLMAMMTIAVMGMWATTTWADGGSDCCGEGDSCCKKVEQETPTCCEGEENPGEGDCCKSSSGHDHSHDEDHSHG